MSKFCTFFSALIFTFSSFGQINEDLNPEERAYLFHIVKKSPILNNNFGRYFDYQGPLIKFSNGKVNYDSVELLIINNPQYLTIRKQEIAKSPKGLIAEASNKMAIWELNKVLLAKRSSPNNLKQYENEYRNFESLLLEKLPPNATKIKNQTVSLHPKLLNIMNPSLTLDDKIMQIGAMRFLTVNDQLLTIKAMNESVNKYVENRSRQIYSALGGKAESFTNILVAAGDGSSTTGILEEREKNEKGKWNKGLPKAVGLFPYDIILETIHEKKKTKTIIEPMRYTENNFKTFGKNKITNVHLDVWGYNSEKQTTVVIEKNGLSYHLFGSKNTRFLSPDSSFSDGTTFQSIINDLEFNKIEKLNEIISGRRGFNYWIALNKKKKDATELKIEKYEKEYSDLGYVPISTSRKPSRQVKRSKRKAIRSGSATFNGTPTTKSNRSERKKLQNTIVNHYGLFESYKIKIAELEKQKQKAIDLLAQYQRKLDVYKTIMGRRWAKFEEKKGMYIFEDSSTFDLSTQEFQFKPSEKIEDFEIRLIAIPESCLSKSADEVMMHINVMDAIPDYDARVRLELEDVFDSDKWELKGPLFSDKDSVALHVFFEGLLNRKTNFDLIARGQGIGKWDGSRTVKDVHPLELNKYPDNAAITKFDTIFKRLRKSEVLIHIDRSIRLEINSFTDNISSNIVIENDNIQSEMGKYGLSKNEILSALRTASIMRALKEEINVLSGKYLSRENASIVIDRFNKKWSKTRISVGPTSFKLSSLQNNLL
jgi:hypothetical protein